MRTYKGFTFLELMVTIAIIAILSIIAFVSMRNIRAKARDTSRVSSVNQIVGALEQYYGRNGSYPTFIIAGEPIMKGTSTYLASVPSNSVPRTDGDCPDKDFHYEASPDGRSYYLTFCLGNDSGRLAKGINVCTNGNCTSGDSLTVKDADGNSYGTVSIGGMVWLDQNLRRGVRVDGSGNQGDADGNTIEKYCYGDDPQNCETLGALYQWHTAMALPQSCDATNAGCTVNAMHQGICPTGWHVPTDAEWHTLELVYADPANNANCDAGHDNGNCAPAGDYLKSPNLWNGEPGNNNSGFTGLPSGYRDSGEFYCSGDDECDTGIYWTASVHNNTNAYVRALSMEDHSEVYRYNNDKAFGLGLRCVMNY